MLTARSGNHGFQSNLISMVHESRNSLRQGGKWLLANSIVASLRKNNRRNQRRETRVGVLNPHQNLQIQNYFQLFIKMSKGQQTNKLEEISILGEDLNPDIWVLLNMDSRRLKISNYQLANTFIRKHFKDGGIAIFTKNKPISKPSILITTQIYILKW